MNTAALTFAAVGITLTAAAAPSRSLSLAAAAAGTESVRLMDDVASRARERGEVSITVKRTGGSGDNLRRLDRGEVRMGIITVGQFLERNRAAPGSLHPILRQPPVAKVALVKASLPATTFSDLGGYRMVPGGAGSSTEWSAVAIMKHLGAGVRWVRAPSERIGAMVASGDADGVFGGPDIIREVLNTPGLPPMRLVGMSDGDFRKVESLMAERSLVRMDFPGGPKAYGVDLILAASGDPDGEEFEAVRKAAEKTCGGCLIGEFPPEVEMARIH